MRNNSVNSFERQVITPAIPQILAGSDYNVFAYGHSGSGNPHSTVGYEYEENGDLGLCLSAGKGLFEELNLNSSYQDSQGNEHLIGTGFSIFELRKNTAFYLSNVRNKCFIREDSDEKPHLRGKTELLDGGKVRVQSLVQRSYRKFESLREELQKSLGRRSVGSSSVHDQSSRMHAILNLEIINRQLIEAQNALIEREAELVPVGKRATDISIEDILTESKRRNFPAKNVLQMRKRKSTQLYRKLILHV
ncbi:hypothetical protein BPAE_0031g00140 [Botrytis paeoniae]|uniref:Kinesin motor domain-containing protein n=1 Tax=Botrytis paeoniae TaxID=278948 RepID=A0A4Z1FZ49_9HELO|nr:hypothetical protein BPAE_0031g00140 [Botrytis paeoniae]